MAADTKRDVRAKENKAKMDALMQAISGENLLLNPEINGQQPAPQ